MQISIYVINNMPEPGRNLAADACMGRTQLSPCIYNFSTRTIRASRNAMPAWYFFHAEPLISRFSLEKYITLLQQLWQTVLMWNLYPIFISLNQLAVKITPAESFLWMHLHQFQYLSIISLGKIGAFSGNWYMIQSDLPWLISSRIWISRILFSCDQAALWMLQSVRLSVCPSLLFHYVPIIVSSWNFQELLPMTEVTSIQKVKDRGQRSRSQRSQPNLIVSGL